MRPDGEYTPEGKELIRKAVQRERTRLWDNRPQDPAAETEAGRNCKKSLGWQAPSLTTSFEKGLEEFLNLSLRKRERSIRVERVAGMTKRKQGALIYADCLTQIRVVATVGSPRSAPLEAPYDLP